MRRIISLGGLVIGDLIGTYLDLEAVPCPEAPYSRGSHHMLVAGHTDVLRSVSKVSLLSLLRSYLKGWEGGLTTPILIVGHCDAGVMSIRPTGLSDSSPGRLGFAGRGFSGGARAQTSCCRGIAMESGLAESVKAGRKPQLACACTISMSPVV